MATEKRIKILTESEVQEFYSPPTFTTNDQRFFFSLDDREHETCKKVRQRRARCMLALLLGYFKSKPVVLTLRYYQAKDDLKYISQYAIPGPGFAPFLEKDARAFGFEWPNESMIIDQAIDECREIKEAIEKQEARMRIQEEIGDLLHSAVSLCDFAGFVVEESLTNVNVKFRNRMQAIKILTHVTCPGIFRPN